MVSQPVKGAGFHTWYLGFHLCTPRTFGSRARGRASTRPRVSQASQFCYSACPQVRARPVPAGQAAPYPCLVVAAWAGFSCHPLALHAQAGEPAWDGLESLTAVLTEAKVAVQLRAEHLDLVAPDARRRGADREPPPEPAGAGARPRSCARAGASRCSTTSAPAIACSRPTRWRARPVPAGSAPALRGDPSLLIAYPASEHPLVEGVSLLLTNRASALKHPDLQARVHVRAHGSRTGAGGRRGRRTSGRGRRRQRADQPAAWPCRPTGGSPKNLLAYLSAPERSPLAGRPRHRLRRQLRQPKPTACRESTAFSSDSRTPTCHRLCCRCSASALCGIAVVVAAGACRGDRPTCARSCFPEAEVFAGFAGRVPLSEREGRQPDLDAARLPTRAGGRARAPTGAAGAFERSEALQIARAQGPAAADVKALDALLDELEQLARAGRCGRSQPRIRVSELQKRGTPGRRAARAARE